MVTRHMPEQPLAKTMLFGFCSGSPPNIYRSWQEFRGRVAIHHWQSELRQEADYASSFAVRMSHRKDCRLV
jgi:hypothetical protein